MSPGFHTLLIGPLRRIACHAANNTHSRIIAFRIDNLYRARFCNTSVSGMIYGK